MKRVAITGMGVVSPLGNDCAALSASLQAGISGVRLLEAPFRERLLAPLAAPAEFPAPDLFPAPRLRMLDRVSQFALHAAAQALADAGPGVLEGDRALAGVSLGTGMGGAHATDEAYLALYGEDADRLKPFSVLLAMNNAAASWIAIEHGLTGPNLTYSTACSSAAVAIGEAARRIRAGDADVMVAGGSEAPLTVGVLKAWEALRVVAAVDADDPSASCKPFAADRSGLVLGEGAAILVLEEWERARRRGARIHAELAGYGLCTDAGHLTRPSVAGQACAMRLALDAAAAVPTEVGYLNAHGTATPANDETETAAIKQVFGGHARRLAVSSTKAVHGHLLGAAGALEFLIAVLALRTQVLPPTMHLARPDPVCDLDYVPRQARPVAGLRTVMSNSFAFGGTNAVLVARAAD